MSAVAGRVAGGACRPAPCSSELTPYVDSGLRPTPGEILEQLHVAEADAIRKANDSVYGLGAAIFSKNKKHAEQLAARELQAGSCFVNAQVHSDPRLPFGGVKQSGYGRELGVFGVREFTNIKTVFVS